MPQPGFDTWTIVFLFAAVQGLFVSFVFLLRREKHPSRFFLAAITLVFSVILIAYVLYWTGYMFYYPYLLCIPVCLVFTFGPLFYLYFKSLFLKNSFTKKDVLHLLPFVLTFAYYSPFIFRSVGAKQAFLSGGAGGGSTANISLIVAWLGIASMVAYSFVIYAVFKPYARLFRQAARWFGLMWLFFAAFTLSYLSYYVLVNFSFFNPAWDYAISFCMTFFIYLLAWAGYRQHKVFNGFGLFEEEKIKYRNSPVSGDAGREIIDGLRRSMLEKKYFLYPDLNLDKLSELTGTNKHYLSQAINERLNMNFFEYINSLRIEEAQRLLTSGKDLTVIEIAYQVGYNNKVSFNKAFKNITGLTPTEFRQQHKTVNYEQN